MANESTLWIVSLVVEEDATIAGRVPYPLRTEAEIRKAILASVAALMSDRPDVLVEWSSLTTMSLNRADGYGRCAVCNHWVYEAELTDGEWRGGVSRGARVGGELRCDEHLPSGHPLCFTGIGYDGPVPQ